MSPFGHRDEFPGEEPRPGWAAWKLLVWAAGLLCAFNVAALLLQHPEVLAYELPSREAIGHGYLWTLLTYALTETHWLLGPLGILLLGIIGRMVEAEVPRGAFLTLCAGCALGGALLWLPLHWSLGDALEPGCSVLVLGLLSFWCFTTPDETVPVKLLFLIPTRPQAFFWLLLALVAAALLAFELPQVLRIPSDLDAAGFGTSAHLGSMLTGALFAWVRQRGLRWHPAHLAAEEDLAPERGPRKHVPVTAGRAVAERDAPPRNAKPIPATKSEWRAEVDRILDKINHEGLGALTADERRILDHAKDKLRK